MFGPGLGLGLTNVATLSKGGGVASAFGALKAALIAGQDAQIVVIGDSTSDQTSEWAYLWLTSKIGPRYQNLRVRYRLYDYSGNVWESPTTVQAGSGGTDGTLDVYNFSVGGTVPSYYAGHRRSVLVGLAPDVVIWNHGHNTDTAVAGRVAASFLTAWETFRLLFPEVPHVVIAQNPNRDDDTKAAIVAVYSAKSALYGDVTTVDAYSRFINAGKPSSWYADNVHPNATGQAEIVEEVDRSYLAARSGAIDVAPAFVATAGTNLLTNGDFSTWPSSVPTGWTANNGATSTKEATTVDADYSRAQSLKLTGNATNSRLTQAFDTAARAAISAAGAVTVAARCYRPNGSAGSVGRLGIVAISPTAGTRAYTTYGMPEPGAWTWVISTVEGLAGDLNYANVELYWDSGNNGGSEVFFDRVIAVAGLIPRSM